MIMSQHHNVPSGATLTGALIGTVRHISSHLRRYWRMAVTESDCSFGRSAGWACRRRRDHARTCTHWSELAGARLRGVRRSVHARPRRTWRGATWVIQFCR